MIDDIVLSSDHLRCHLNIHSNFEISVFVLLLIIVSAVLQNLLTSRDSEFPIKANELSQLNDGKQSRY